MILAFDEFKSACLFLWSCKKDALFLFFQLLIFADMLKICRSDMVLVANLFISFSLCVYANRLDIIKCAKILIICIFIMLLTILADGNNVQYYYQYIGYLLRILTALFIANYYGRRFLFLFENIVFSLVYISIPLYLIQILDVHFYDVFTPFSRMVMNGRQYYWTDYGISMHQYILVFVMNGWAIYRNSGFMWEPAAFGAITSWSLMIYLVLNRFELSYRTLIYILAIITTFSIGAYTYLVVLIALYFVVKFEWKKLIGLFSFVAILFALYLTNDFVYKQITMMTDKAEMYSDVDKSLSSISSSSYNIYNMKHEFEYERSSRTSRIASIKGNWSFFLDNPLGYGMSSSGYLDSANGLVEFIMKWGLLGLFSLLICFYSLAGYILQCKTINMHVFIVKSLVVGLFLASMVGNPIYNQVLLFVFMMLSFFR